MDIESIEREYRRIMKSRRSMVEMTKMADGLFQRISAFFGTLNDETAKSEFRSAYTRTRRNQVRGPAVTLRYEQQQVGYVNA